MDYELVERGVVVYLEAHTVVIAAAPAVWPLALDVEVPKRWSSGSNDSGPVMVSPRFSKKMPPEPSPPVMAEYRYQLASCWLLISTAGFAKSRGARRSGDSPIETMSAVVG